MNNELKKLRKAAGFSQVELAEAVGLTQGAISQTEAGTTTYSATAFNRVLIACSVGKRERQRLILAWFKEQAAQV
tara:strand:+ start:135 stop:359 length:225 start_codon:yes stop_codon:yes gene_type:complete